MEKIFNQKGQILLEMLLAILVFAIIIGAVSGLVYVSSKSGQNSGAKSSAVALAQEGMEAMQSISETKWHDIYLPPAPGGKGDGTEYYLYKNGSSWAITGIDASKRDVSIDGIIYSRKVYIYNVYRDNGGDREIVATGGAEDPSTQKIKIAVSKNGGADVVLEEYLTRWKNNIFGQSDWSGGPGQADFSDPSKYDSDDGNIDTTAPSGIKLKPL